MGVTFSEPSIDVKNGRWRARVRVYEEGKKPRQMTKALGKAEAEKTAERDNGGSDVSLSVSHGSEGVSPAVSQDVSQQGSEQKRPRKVPASVRKAAREWLDGLKAEEAERERLAAERVELLRLHPALGEAEEADGYELPGEKKALTVHECVESFIDSKAAAGKVTPNTVSGYRTILKRRIGPYLGKAELSKLDAKLIRQWISAISAKVGQNSVHKACVVLKAALDRAVADGDIPANPMRGVNVDVPGQVAPKPNPLDAAGSSTVRRWCDLNPTEPFSLAVRLALLTGMRRGEVCGLRWCDIDLDNRTIRVRRAISSASTEDLEREERRLAKGRARTLERVPGSDRLYVKTPKTAEGDRTVTFPESLVKVLRDRRKAVEAECMTFGCKLTDEHYVCGAAAVGVPLDPARVTVAWREVAHMLRLRGSEGRPPVFHDLRHTYATLTLAGGVDVKTVANQLGHDPAMTLRIYAGVDRAAAYRAADVMDAAASMEGATVLQFPATGTEGA